MTTAASMAAAVDNASPPRMATTSSGATLSLLTGSHHNPNASTHVQESLPRSDDTTAAVATSTLLHSKVHTNGGGIKNVNVDVDVGLLPISERSLDSVQEESLLGVDDAMTAVVTSTVLHTNGHNSNMDSRATTTIGRGSGAGVTGDVIVDAGMLQTKRSLSSVGDDCNSCASRPEISQTDFFDLVYSCSADTSDCPEGVPIGCWNTSEVTDT